MIGGREKRANVEAGGTDRREGFPHHQKNRTGTTKKEPVDCERVGIEGRRREDEAAEGAGEAQRGME